PPNYTIDNQSGQTTQGPGNPGNRLANDRGTGFMYDVYLNGTGSNHFNYILNRSTDGGQTWTLNGNANGIVVDNAESNFGGKFGTVNALLGGVDHAAVDPTTGYVYVVYGARDGATGNNRLELARLQNDASGNMNVALKSFVTG